MKLMRSKIFIILIFTFTLLVSTYNTFVLYAIDWYEGKTIWYEECRGARISIWDVDTDELLHKIDIVDIDYETAKDYRRFSDFTKPEIIALNGKFTDEMIFGFLTPIKLGTNLYDKSIKLPEMFNRINVTDDEKNEKIKF